MNENENEIIIDSNNNEEVPVEEFTEEVREEKPADKPKRTPQEELDYFEGRAKRLRKELGINDEPKPKKESKSNEVDYGLEAYLTAKGIPDEDTDFILETMKDTKKSAKELLGKSWFQSELKERLEQRTTDKAIPKGTKRSTTVARDTVDYHLEKYESGQTKLEDMPFEMREKVLEKALEKKANSQKFQFTH